MGKAISIIKDIIKKTVLSLWFIIKYSFFFIRLIIKYPVLFIIWIVWDFSGIRYIITKIKPSLNKDEKLPNYRRPATFFLWIIGIYVALFGIASNRYENRADKIENRINAIYAQIPKDMKVAFARIDDVQNMACPYKPNIFQPVSVIKSFKFVVTSNEYQKLIEEKKSSKRATWFLKNFYLVDIKYDDGIEQLKQLVEDWAQKTKVINDKDGEKKEVGELYGFDLKGVHLEKAELSNAHLEDADLELANLQNADLFYAHLENADLIDAHLENADLIDAHLENANLLGANLENANLVGAHLENANLLGAHLENADLMGAYLQNTLFCRADLKNAKNLTVDQLSEVFSLWSVINLDTKLKEKVKKINPKLFEPNYEVLGCNDKGQGLYWSYYLKTQKK